MFLPRTWNIIITNNTTITHTTRLFLLLFLLELLNTHNLQD